MELTAGEVWSQILEGAKQALPEQAFRTWLQPTQAVAISQDLLVVSTPNPFAVDWVEDKYAELLTGIGEHLFGRRFQLSVQFTKDGRPAAVSIPQAAAPAAPVPQPAPTPAPRYEPPAQPALSARPSAPLNPRYTFDRFVVGNNNQLSAAAAHAVAEAPALMYNPLFIYGGVGLGKTHLMHAIGYAMLERDPTKKVMYLSSERFTNELVSAIQEGSMAEFRRHYRQIDLLMVDDIQFLEGKERTQEEFFHTFNALYEAQKQIVLTSDRPPKEIGLEDRLISRFEWGLVTDIKAPDFETRMAILRKRVEEDGLQISGLDDVLTLIARSRSSSVREIEGAVIKLLAYSSLTGRQIDLELAQEALGGGIVRPGGGGGAARRRDGWRRHPRAGAARRGRGVGHDGRGAPVQEAHQGPHRSPAGGDVPDQGTVRPVAGGDREAVRRARPLHGDPLGRQGGRRAAHRCGLPPARGADPGHLPVAAS
jgi:chromosomal replication initiator protein